MDILGQAKDLMGDSGIEGVKDKLVDLVDDIPIVGDNIADMIKGFGGSNEEAAEETEESSDESEEADATEEAADDTEETEESEESEEESDETEGA